jgi:hypothetical protein
MKHQQVESVLLLYSTSGCHLCERAEALIRKWPGITFNVLEVADDAKLLERYGVRIPVLCRLETGQELDWPFDEDAVDRFLAV